MCSGLTACPFPCLHNASYLIFKISQACRWPPLTNSITSRIRWRSAWWRISFNGSWAATAGTASASAHSGNTFDRRATSNAPCISHKWLWQASTHLIQFSSSRTLPGQAWRSARCRMAASRGEWQRIFMYPFSRLLKYWFARMRPRTSTAQNGLQAIILSLARGGAPEFDS